MAGKGHRTADDQAGFLRNNRSDGTLQGAGQECRHQVFEIKRIAVDTGALEGRAGDERLQRLDEAHVSQAFQKLPDGPGADLRVRRPRRAPVEETEDRRKRGNRLSACAELHGACCPAPVRFDENRVGRSEIKADGLRHAGHSGQIRHPATARENTQPGSRRVGASGSKGMGSGVRTYVLSAEDARRYCRIVLPSPSLNEKPTRLPDCSSGLRMGLVSVPIIPAFRPRRLLPGSG